MHVYTVHEPPNAPADRQDRAEVLKFVREGFSWVAALLGPLWLLARGLWLALLGYVATVVIIELIVAMTGARQDVGTFAILVLHLLIGLEADSIERWTLDRRGWKPLGSVTGDSRLDCERRFLALWLPVQPLIRADTLAASSMVEMGMRSAGSPRPPAPARWRSAFPFGSKA